MFLLDTNVVSELRKAKTGRIDPKVLAWSKSIPPTSLYISAITLLELEQGVLAKELTDQAQGAMLRAWLDGQVIPAFD